MADDAANRKAIADWINKPYASYSPRRETAPLISAFNDFVTRERGAIVSPPGDKLIRVECPEGSSLPIRVAEAGFKLNFLNPGTRNTSSGVVPVDIFETKLPGR